MLSEKRSFCSVVSPPYNNHQPILASASLNIQCVPFKGTQFAKIVQDPKMGGLLHFSS